MRKDGVAATAPKCLDFPHVTEIENYLGDHYFSLIEKNVGMGDQGLSPAINTTIPAFTQNTGFRLASEAS